MRGSNRSALTRFFSALGLSLSLLAGACSSPLGALFDLAAPPPRDLGPGSSPYDMQTVRRFTWLKQLPMSNSAALVKKLALDPAGNLYAACEFAGLTDFGGSQVQGQGNHDVAVVKLSPQGDLIWVRTIGGAGLETMLDMAVDASGNVILAASFSQPLSFGGGSMISHGAEDFLLAKYSSDGTPLWAKALGGSGSERDYGSLAVDAAGNIYFAGSFSLDSRSSIDFGGGPMTSAGLADGFVAKFSPAGDHVFSRQLGGPTDDWVSCLALDPSGDLIIGGQVHGTIDLGGGVMDPGFGIALWAFLQRLGPDGRHKWAIGYYSSQSRITQLAIDFRGFITAAGSYGLSLKTKTTSLASLYARGRGFLVHLDAAGNEKWARGTVYSSLGDIPRVLIADGYDLLLGGSFEAYATLVDPPRVYSAGLSDAFLVLYDFAGTPQKGFKIGGKQEEWLGAIASSRELLYVGGQFKGTVDFRGQSLSPSGYSDGFIMALDQANWWLP